MFAFFDFFFWKFLISIVISKLLEKHFEDVLSCEKVFFLTLSFFTWKNRCKKKERCVYLLRCEGRPVMASRLI